MLYQCMSFGWYQELLQEVEVEGLAAAEKTIVAMLDRDAMIVHAYAGSDAENPELVGRHSRLQSFIGRSVDRPASAHQVERFLIERSNLASWSQASRANSLLDQRWLIAELWPSDGFSDCEQSYVYGRAVLVDRTVLEGHLQAACTCRPASDYHFSRL